MITTPRQLLDTSLAQLPMLRAFLCEQLGARAGESERHATPEAIACQEIVVALGALIAKVQAAGRLSGTTKTHFHEHQRVNLFRKFPECQR
jgi:hypothetical protein